MVEWRTGPMSGSGCNLKCAPCPNMDEARLLSLVWLDPHQGGHERRTPVPPLASAVGGAVKVERRKGKKKKKKKKSEIKLK